MEIFLQSFFSMSLSCVTNWKQWEKNRQITMISSVTELKQCRPNCISSVMEFLQRWVKISYIFCLLVVVFQSVRGCCAKFATGLNIIISHKSKSIWVIKLSFCQTDPLVGESFWQKDSLINHIFFEAWLIMIFSPVTNIAQQALLEGLFEFWAHEYKS